MVYKIYSIRDQFAGFLTPTVEQNDDIAKRAFKLAINRPDTIVYANPTHFDLYQIGEFDTSNGTITAIEPVIVATGLSLKENYDAK